MPKESKRNLKTDSRPYFNLALKMAQPKSSQSPAASQEEIMQCPIPLSELLKEAGRIKEFRGDRSYDLSSFIREVEIFLPLFENTSMSDYIFQRCVVNKLQGNALNAVRTLGSLSSWDDIKEQLIKNFGIRETYHQLYFQALNARNRNNVSQYFEYLRNILDKLNTKYEQDNKKPIEFCPKMNESMMLKTFLNNISAHLASIVYSRNIQTLREAYYTLEETGLVRPRRTYEKVNMTNDRLFNNGQSNQTNNPTILKNKPEQIQLNSGQFRQNKSGQIKQNYSGQYRTKYSNNSGQSRQVEPMEIDHLDQVPENEQVHFLLDRNKHIYR
jgi:hypothetical protein